MGPFDWTHNGQPIADQDGQPILAGRVRRRLKLPACEDCNETLNTRFEQPAKQVLRALFAADGALQLSARDATVVGLWFAKTLLLGARPEAWYELPAIDAEAKKIRLAAEQMPPSRYYDWLTNGDAPPAGLSVWLHRTDPTEPGPPRYQVPLPRLTADGTTIEFVAFSVALHGLCVTVVVHPGWAIEHPLEVTGQAVRLLPEPQGAVDVAAMPTLGVRTVQWLRCQVELKPGVLGTVDLPPLRATRDPMALIVEALPYAKSWGA